MQREPWPATTPTHLPDFRRSRRRYRCHLQAFACSDSRPFLLRSTSVGCCLMLHEVKFQLPTEPSLNIPGDYVSRTAPYCITSTVDLRLPTVSTIFEAHVRFPSRATSIHSAHGLWGQAHSRILNGGQYLLAASSKAMSSALQRVEMRSNRARRNTISGLDSIDIHGRMESWVNGHGGE